MGSKAKRTWKEQLQDSRGFPNLKPIEGKMLSKWGEGTMLIAAPVEVDEIMKTVKKGKLITIDEIRRQLSEKHGATVTCPLTTGIFAWIAANAADEDEQQGRSRITPYWRTVKARSELNPKYPGGIDNVRRRLESEGHKIVQRGKKYFVESLMKPARSKSTQE